MTTATMRLIEAVERLQEGRISAHTLDPLHELASLARLEQPRPEHAASTRAAGEVLLSRPFLSGNDKGRVRKLLRGAR